MNVVAALDYVATGIIEIDFGSLINLYFNPFEFVVVTGEVLLPLILACLTGNLVVAASFRVSS